MKRVLKWIALAIPVVLLGWFAVAFVRSDNACSDPGAGSPAHPIKAIVYCDYGLADRLKLADIEKPVPEAGQILVKVRAAAANPLDWHYLRGTPYVMRLGAGLRRPSEIRLGVDYSGVVESVGPGVTRFKPGDEVFGARTGAFGEYVAARSEGSVVLKPPGISFEQAAAVPVAAITALQGLRVAGVGPGARVLINGASGGVGTFAVQIAKAQGAIVTGVCSGRNVELVKSLGADAVIDYTKENYTTQGAKYDAIIDNVANNGILANRGALTPTGKYVLIGGGGPDNGKWIGPLINPIKAMLISPFVKQDLDVLFAELSPADLELLGKLMRDGKVTPVIDRRYSLAETPEAIRYLETGRARGKVIIVP
ncbi:MAG TPA: NAD(P)-dependent alcohol dehydrogenase [Steroidobacteraceae bacterium]|jgi:NADPH:quinone reductase-like Zn-dependent oxidoreductase|nr:NAD(P)-dependent alcohol dehydrogenase [Steroidobacteraceae bacterium]